MSKQRYEEIMKESFLGEVTKAVHDVDKDTTNHQTSWPELEMKLYWKPKNIFCLTKSYCKQHVVDFCCCGFLDYVWKFSIQKLFNAEENSLRDNS